MEISDAPCTLSENQYPIITQSSAMVGVMMTVVMMTMMTMTMMMMMLNLAALEYVVTCIKTLKPEPYTINPRRRDPKPSPPKHKP